MGNEAQAKQAGTEQCQGPRFRNRVATKVHHSLRPVGVNCKANTRSLKSSSAPGPGKSSQPR